MKKAIIFVVTVATTMLVAAYTCSKRAGDTSADALLRANVKALADSKVYPLCGESPDYECVYFYSPDDIDIFPGLFDFGD